MTFSAEDLPQKYPMRMVDEFLEVTPGKGAKAKKVVQENDYFLADTATNDKALLRPVILEALAQTGVSAILSLPENQEKNVFFGGIKKAAFHDDFRVGDELILSVEMQKFRHTVGTGHCTVTRDEEIICEADLSFIIVDQ